jgi:hypothetical protein
LCSAAGWVYLSGVAADVELIGAVRAALRGAWVRSFAETHELSPLSRREALKHLS